MIGEHWFWWLLAVACIVWYSTITVYVAYRGFFDIKRMLKNLSATEEHPEDAGKPEP
jgi:hypothetical protein